MGASSCMLVFMFFGVLGLTAPNSYARSIALGHYESQHAKLASWVGPEDPENRRWLRGDRGARGPLVPAPHANRQYNQKAYAPPPATL